MQNREQPELRFSKFEGNWEESKAKNIFKSINERNQPNLPVLSVTQDSGVVFRDDVGIDIKYDKTTLNSYKVIHPGNFVISLRSFQGGFELSDKNGITSPAYTVFIPQNSKNQNKLFWKTKFKTFNFIESLKTVTFGIRDGKSISFSEFGDLKLKYPSDVNEQKEIGSFFEQLDKNIDLHQQELTTLKQTKQGFLQKMFPKEGKKVPEVRFPGFTDDWELRKWYDTVKMSTDMVDPKEGKYDDLLHIGPGNIESFTGRILNNVKSVREDNLISGKFYFNSGDIIYGKINPQLAKYAYVNFEGLTSADTYVLNSYNGIAQDFLFVILQTKDFYKYSVSVSMRTGMPKINRDELNQYNYLAPSNIDEQRKIGSFFKQLDETIALHQRKLELLQLTKKAFLQKLFV